MNLCFTKGYDAVRIFQFYKNWICVYKKFQALQPAPLMDVLLFESVPLKLFMWVKLNSVAISSRNIVLVLGVQFHRTVLATLFLHLFTINVHVQYSFFCLYFNIFLKVHSQPFFISWIGPTSTIFQQNYFFITGLFVQRLISGVT